MTINDNFRQSPEVGRYTPSLDAIKPKSRQSAIPRQAEHKAKKSANELDTKVC